MRLRITKPELVRSSDPHVNSRIVRKSKQRGRRIERTRTVEVFIKNAFDTKDRFIYINNSF